MGNGEEEASRDCEGRIDATRRAHGRRGTESEPRRTHREDGMGLEDQGGWAGSYVGLMGMTD